MTGIDSVTAAILASRIGSVLTDDVAPAAGGAAAAQIGTPQAAPGGAAAPDANGASAPLASAQAVLSEVALTLDAISRFGGAVTPAVAGDAPLLPAPPPAAAAAQLDSLLFPLDPGGPGSPGTQAATAAAPVQPAVLASPAAALAAALAQVVDESGLFYESHLAQWLAGERSTAALAREPQARMAGGADPAASDAALAHAVLADASDGALARVSFADAGGARATAQSGAGSATAGASSAGTNDAGAAGRPAPDNSTAAAAARAADAYASVSADAFAKPGATAQSLFSADAGTAANAAAGHAAAHASAAAPQSIAASIHPATLPIVRQQLDLLATHQFHWIGELWPGARLDWVVEPDGHAGSTAADDGIAWRTRVTLALPALGTVDAELVLTGTRLAARVRASEDGAARLTARSEALRRSLGAAGIELGSLSIRSIEDMPAGFDQAAAQAAAALYARGAAASGDAVASSASVDPASSVNSAPASAGSRAEEPHARAADDWAWLE